MDLHILKSLQDNLASLTAASSSNLLNPQAVPDPFLNSFDSSDATNSEAEEPDADYKKKRGKLSSSSKKIRKENTRREKYNVIPNDLRLELIDCVINKGEKIKRAATRLGINYSSAKSIFQVYKKEGRSDKKCSKKNIQKERASPKSNFTNVPANNLAFPLLEEPKKTENLLPNSLLEAFKSSQGTASKSADLSLLNIVKSESAPNYSGSELNLTRKHSMEVEANKGFGVIPPPSGQLGTKVTPNNNFLSNNSAFSKFPRNNSAFSPASTQSSFNLLSPKPILKDQQNILKEVSGNKSQDYGSSKGSFLNSSSTLAQNQSFKLYKGNEQVVIGDQDDRQTQLIKQMSEEERQTLMRTLRYLIPQSDLIHSGFTQNNLAMEQTIHIPPLDLRLRSQE